MGVLTNFEHIAREGEPLAPYTWLRLGGPAQYFAEPTSVDELAALVRRACDEGLPVRLLGGGSNLLVREEGVSGLVIHLSAAVFGEIRRQKDTIIAGGGAKLGHVISTAVREGLGGLETMVGIPGTVGGALHGNAGSRGGDIGQWVGSATVMTRTGEIITHERRDLDFAYRRSSLDELVILQATFELENDAPAELTKRMQRQWITKQASQPLSHQAVGCVFKNANGVSAGMIIDQAGLKGARVGGDEISDRHANYLIAEPGALPHDVLRLIELVRARVNDRAGIQLELQIEVW